MCKSRVASHRKDSHGRNQSSTVPALLIFEGDRPQPCRSVIRVAGSTIDVLTLQRPLLWELSRYFAVPATAILPRESGHCHAHCASPRSSTTQATSEVHALLFFFFLQHTRTQYWIRSHTEQHTTRYPGEQAHEPAAGPWWWCPGVDQIHWLAQACPTNKKNPPRRTISAACCCGVTVQCRSRLSRDVRHCPRCADTAAKSTVPNSPDRSEIGSRFSLGKTEGHDI